MPRIRLAQPFDDVHGSLSGRTVNNRVVLSSSRREANTCRSWQAPDNPRSFRQTEIRRFMALSAAAYRDLDKADADDWNDAANAKNRENILGLEYFLTGVGLFSMLNMYRQIAGQPVTAEIPDFFTPPIPIAVNKAICFASTVFKAEVNVDGLEDGGHVYIRVSPPLPGAARRARSNYCRMLDVTLSNNIMEYHTNPILMSLAMPQNYIKTGNRIGIEVRSLSKLWWPGPALLVPNILVTAS